MKRFLLCALVIGLAATTLQAQTTRKKTSARRTVTTRTAARLKPAPAPAISITSTGDYAARMPAASPNRLSIADPTINTLNARANGSNVPVSKSGIVGMPKRAYGFANGRLMLNSTGSTSSGTITGSGAVGTGSSLGSIGSNGPAIGLNGKSPYAGSTMWGNARNMTLRYGDSAVRQANGRRD